MEVITEPVGISPVSDLLPGYSLENYPNPFRHATNISFTIPDDTYVQLSIFDLSGRIVQNLLADAKSGSLSVLWNGENHYGEQVRPGVYICRLIAGNHSESIRIIRQ